MSRSVKILLGVLGGVVLVLVLLPLFAGSGLFGSGPMMGQGGMMGRGGMMGGGWGVLGMAGMVLFPLLFFGGLIAVIVLAVMQLGSGERAASERHAAGSAGVHDQSAEEILRQRFARGEIDAEEYEKRGRVLNEQHRREQVPN